jgi:cell wall-associated NlpC family hydrolase
MSDANDAIYQTASSYVGVHIPYGTGAGHIDCSHFLARVMTDATGTDYPYMVANDYANSSLYTVVTEPAAGDIVYWTHHPHGHVGVVLDPMQGTFIGSQSKHGVGTANYSSGYWARHGNGPRFLHYVGPAR